MSKLVNGPISFKAMAMSMIALVAFAGNSVLCRIALSDGAIHPASFTSIRLVSGAIVLMALVLLSNVSKQQTGNYINKGWAAPTILFLYAALFSFAYITLDTGVGALILFGAVQITMVAVSLIRGAKLSWLEWFGLLMACAGLLYLVFPELSKPSLSGFLMMSGAGVAWGLYTVLGQGSQNPLADTASNFIKTVPLSVILLMLFSSQWLATDFSDRLVVTAWLFAILSGAVTSGVGYAIWYAALRYLKSNQAGVMQLLVPIIAAIGGVIFAGELLTYRLIFASALVLGGILIVISAKQKIA